MICREFTKKIEESTLAELRNVADPQVLDHERECPSCAEWLQQRHALGGALQALRKSTSGLEAPVSLEHKVLRAFRQSMPASVAAEVPSQAFVFRLSHFFGWGAYVAAAAALAISLGLGVWYLAHSNNAGNSAAHKTTAAQVQATSQPAKTAQVPVTQSVRSSQQTERAAIVRGGQSFSSAPTPVQAEQAQGYTPMMLCDPLSCSGDEQVVRMQLPAPDGTQESQMADVIIGDDGLVRAIRIVQQ